MTNDNTFDDFDTTITAEEFYEADRDDHAIEADRDWNVYPHDLDGYEHPEFDS